MKNIKSAMFAAVTLVALSFSLAPAFAADSSTTVDAGKPEMGRSFKRGHGGPGCGGGRSHKGGFVKALGITTDQLEKFNTLKQGFIASTASKKAELKVLSSELRDDMTKPGVSKNQMLELQGKINEIKAQLSNSRISFMADRMAILTDDQKAKIREFSLKRSMGPGGKHHRGGFKRGFHHGGKRFGGPRTSMNEGAPVAPVQAPPAIES